MAPIAPTPPVFEPVELPSRYAKAIVAILTAVMGIVLTAISDNQFTVEEIGNIGVALLTSVLVYLVPNLDAGAARYLKFIIAILGAGLQALVSVLMDGQIVPQEWVLVGLALLGAVSVGIVPNVEQVREIVPEEDGYIGKHVLRT